MATDQSEYRLAVENLKARLKERQITYAELAEGIGMSESGVKKIFTGSDGSFQRLAQICKYAGVSLAEIVQSTKTIDVGFTDAQQTAFLREPALFQFYWMLAYEREALENTEKFFRLTKADSFRQLRQLDLLGLIKLLPGDRIRLPSVKAIRWSGDGPFMRKIYQDWSQRLVAKMAKPVTDPHELFIVRYFKMLPKTYNDFLQAQRALETEFVRRAIQEMRTGDSQLEHVRWLVAADQQSFLGD